MEVQRAQCGDAQADGDIACGQAVRGIAQQRMQEVTEGAVTQVHQVGAEKQHHGDAKQELRIVGLFLINYIVVIHDDLRCVGGSDLA
ncbi:hypothetical protein D3C86_1754840 [compost metagenome]